LKQETTGRVYYRHVSGGIPPGRPELLSSPVSFENMGCENICRKDA